MRGRGFGILGNIIVGIIGGFLGGWLFGLIGLEAKASFMGSLVTATVGAVFAIWVVRLISQ